MEDLGQTILIIAIMVAVLLGAYYATKFLAKRGKRLTRSKYIKVIDQVHIAQDKQIALINVGGKNILVGITNQSINLIAQLDKENNDEIAKQEQEEKNQTKDFPKTIFEFVKNARNSQEQLNDAREAAKKKRKTEGKDFASIIKKVKKENAEEDNFPPEGKSE